MFSSKSVVTHSPATNILTICNSNYHWHNIWTTRMPIVHLVNIAKQFRWCSIISMSGMSCHVVLLLDECITTKGPLSKLAVQCGVFNHMNDTKFE